MKLADLKSMKDEANNSANPDLFAPVVCNPSATEGFNVLEVTFETVENIQKNDPNWKIFEIEELDALTVESMFDNGEIGIIGNTIVAKLSQNGLDVLQKTGHLLLKTSLEKGFITKLYNYQDPQDNEFYQLVKNIQPTLVN